MDSIKNSASWHDHIEYVLGNHSRLLRIQQMPAKPPFDEQVIDFFNDLSQVISKTSAVKQYPDMIALAFWLRRGNIQAMRKDYNDCTERLGRGLVFHIAPGNVALSFFYSLAIGLLAGNTNIVRLPSRIFTQADLLCRILLSMEDNYATLYERICLIRYPHNNEITDKVSALCHSRIIWGGDATIMTIRQSPLPPRANEITFANRFSILLIDADKYLSDYNPQKTAHDFYNDTYLSDQNACSSPRIIFWLGKRIDEAKDIFWRAIREHLDNYELVPVITVDKMVTFCKFAAINDCRLIREHDYKILRVQLERIDKSVLACLGNSGYFYEYNIKDISEIVPICAWELQTLSYIGLDSNILRNLIISYSPSGVDRIVPIGHTMDFELTWDGIDIIRQLSRIISTN